MPIISSSSPDRDLSDLVEKVRAFGAGLGIKDDTVAYLTSDITSTATSFTVDDATGLSKGWIEIGLELIRVKSVDVTSNVVTVAPGGRGFRGTIPTEHSSNDEVLFTPIMPRSVVVREINREIAGTYPTIPAVDTEPLTISDPINRLYGIPADVAMVLDVRAKDPLGRWHRIRRWETEFGLDTTDYPNGVGIHVFDALPVSTPLQVVYAKRPNLLNGLGDAFSDTGLPDSMADVIELGAMVRLLPAFDMGRLHTLTVPENDIGAQRQVGGGSIVARELKAQYQVRLAAEQLAFSKQYPPRFHQVS